MNIHKLFPSKFVKYYDLNGKDVTVTIEKVVLEEVGAPPHEEEKPVAYFRGAKKGLILNLTNATTIASLYGPETQDWHGQRITLYPTQVRAFGKMHDVIRIRDTKPAPKPEPAADLDDPEDVVDPEDAAAEVE